MLRAGFIVFVLLAVSAAQCLTTVSSQDYVVDLEVSDEVTVAVRVATTEDLASLTFRIVYDADLLTFVTGSADLSNPRLAGDDITLTVEAPGRVSFNGLDWSFDPTGGLLRAVLTGDDVLFSFRLQAVNYGVSAIDFVEITAFQSGGGNDSTATTSGSVTVEGLGDIVFSPPGGAYNSAQAVTLSAGNATAIYYTLDGTEPTATPALLYTVPFAVNGAHDETVTVTVLAVDDQSRGKRDSADYLFDFADPLPPTDLDLIAEDDTGALDSDNLTKQTTGLTVTGTAEAGSTVKLWAGGSRVLLASGTAADFAAPGLDIALGQGVNAVTATATDAAGNESSASAPLTITVDAILPPPPQITTPIDDSDRTNPVVSVTGTAEGLTDVSVFRGAQLVGTVSADAGGDWSLETGSLDNGTHVFEATATDAAGNTSPSSASATTRLDASFIAATDWSGSTAEGWLNWVSGDIALTRVASGGAEGGYVRSRLDLLTANVDSDLWWPCYRAPPTSEPINGDFTNASVSVALNDFGTVDLQGGSLHFFVGEWDPGTGTSTFWIFRTPVAAATAGSWQTRHLQLTAVEADWEARGDVPYRALAELLVRPQQWGFVIVGAARAQPLGFLGFDSLRVTSGPIVHVVQAAAQPDPTLAEPVDFTVTFSAPVTGFSGGSVALGGTAFAGTATVTGGPGTYNVAVSDLAADGTVTVTIPAGAAVDANGHANQLSQSTDNEVTYDGTAPTLAPVSIASDNPDPAWARVGDEVTVSFTASEPLAALPMVTIDGHAAGSVVSTGPDSYAASRVMQTGDTTAGPLPLRIEFSDPAGNPGVPVIATTDGSAVRFDETAPTVTVAAAGLTNDSTPALAGTVSDAAATVSVQIGVGPLFAAVNQGGGVWILPDGTVTPALTDGTYDLTATATDPAGNVGTDTAVAGLTVDTQAPVAVASAASRTSVTVDYQEELTGAATSGNYTLSPALAVTGVVLAAGRYELTTAEQAPGQLYTITITGVADAAGNPVANSPQFRALDDVPPSVDAFSVQDPTETVPGLTDQRDVDVTITDSDVGGTVSAWLISESAVPPAPAAAGWVTTRPTAFTLSVGDGQKTLYAWVKDDSDNVSALTDASQTNITLDSGRFFSLHLTNSAISDLVFGEWSGASADFDVNQDAVVESKQSATLGHAYFFNSAVTDPAKQMLSCDVRNYGQTSRWRLVVDVPEGRGSCTLTWDASEAEAGRELYFQWLVLDSETGRGLPIDLKPSGGSLEVTEDSEFEIVHAPAVDVTFQLQPGWNLIGSSVLSLLTVDEAFRDNAGARIKVGPVWYWTGGIMQAVADAASAVPEWGVWVYALRSVTSRIVSGPPPDGVFVLRRGWNFISPVDQWTVPADPAISGPVWRWDPFWQEYLAVHSGVLEPGQGYALYLDADELEIRTGTD